MFGRTIRTTAILLLLVIASAAPGIELAGTAIASNHAKPPEVKIENPRNGASVSGTVAIEVRAKKRDLDLERTDLFIGDVLVTSLTAGRFTYSWDTTGLAGSHTIKAIVWDVGGHSASASSTVTVASSGSTPAVLSVAVNPHMVTGGDPSTGTVGLTSAAPDGGTSVTLSSSHPDIAAVPASVTVPAGQTTATFPVTTAAVAATTEVMISASAGGATEMTTLTVTPPSGDGTLNALTIDPDQVIGGETSQGTVTLVAAVGGDTVVTLTSSDESVATVPASVTVLAGATSAVFPITTLPNNSGQGQFAVISGHAGGVTRGASITTVGEPSGPAVSSVALFPATLGGGGLSTGIVTFDAALNDGVRIFYTSSHPEIVQVPEEAAVIWSTTQRAFPVTTSPVSTNMEVTITATACCGSVGEATATLVVTTDSPPPPDIVEVKDARWTPGGRGGTLEVRATSTSETAILNVYRGGTDIRLLTLRPVGGGRYEGEQSFGGGATNPGTIDVRSNLGGSGSSDVQE